MTDEEGEKRTGNIGVPVAIITALAAGGGGSALISGQGNLHEQVTAIRDRVIVMGQELAAEELRVMQEIGRIDQQAANRSRRVRDETEAAILRIEEHYNSEIRDLIDRIAELEVHLAKTEAKLDAIRR